MKVTIELPLERYYRLRNKCDESSSEFSVLRMAASSVGRRETTLSVFIEIVCDNHQAEALLVLATRLCPDAVPAIRRALKFPSDN